MSLGVDTLLTFVHISFPDKSDPKKLGVTELQGILKVAM